MEEVNRRRRTVLQVQVGELHLWRLSQSSSPRKCRFHLGFSLGKGSQGNGSGFRRSARMLCALQIAVNAEALAPSAVR